MAVEVELCAVAEQPELHDVDDVLVEPELDRPIRQAHRIQVADPVVEQLQIELLDAAVDDEVIDVGKLADHANGAAGDRVREWGQSGLKKPQIRVERRVRKPHRQLGVHFIGQRDASRPRHHEPRRRGFEFRGEELATQREPASQLPDALVAGEQIVHAQAHVVPGNFERAGSRGGELQDT